MIDILDDSIATPDRFLKDSSGNLTTEINPNFISWKNREQAMFTFINSTLSPSILALTIGQRFAKGVWKVLEKRFASVSRSHVMSLRNELSAVKKGTDTIDGYFQKIKEIRDKLVAVSIVLDDEELLHIALDGLPSEYDSFSSAIRTRSDILSVEELNTLLNAEERVIKKRINNGSSFPAMAMNMNFQSQNHGFSNQHGRGGRYSNQRGRGGRGNYNNHNSFTNNNGGFANSGNSGQYFKPQSSQGPPSQPSSTRMYCQICGKGGHLALDCYHRMDSAYQGRHPPAKLASMVANSSQVQGYNGWLTDTGCSDHVTPNLSQLSLH